MKKLQPIPSMAMARAQRAWAKKQPPTPPQEAK